MRRTFAVTRVQPAAALASFRFAGGAPTHHDHSGSFSRPLTAEEQLAMNDVKNRTVSKIVPGKLFMRHWIATEQSTYSIALRAVFLTAIGVTGIYFGLYSGSGYSNLSWLQFAFAVAVANYVVLHTTHPVWMTAFISAYVALYLLW